MLEKIGLPAKPSMKGGNWVVDASHCQGCSSQFTFINRKHHCRRCGGLFCNSCTSQRMVLRGQGDSPVRICDPCKKIEEAARFERYNYRNRNAKGTTKQASKLEEELLSNILGKDGKKLLSSEMEPEDDANLNLKRFTGSGTSSTVREKSLDSGLERDVTGSMSAEIHSTAPDDFGSTSPEKLRQQAVEEKKKYKILKAEGKSDEALRAFKHGKELERQAAALELALRKNRRVTLKASNLSTATVNQKIGGYEESMGTHKIPSRKGKEAKGDLEDELRELGWCDADLHDAEGKSAKLSLEGELSNLLGEATQKSFHGKKSIGVDKSKVIAMKKKALLLKREGKLAEAKEELKKAKILEKELEEQELLGQSEDSDDELSALIRNMDEDPQDELSDNAFRFDHSIGFTDDFHMDSNLEVTEDDMNDPELASALKSFGWTENDDEDRTIEQSALIDQESLRVRILNLKKEAVSQKRAGNISEAMDFLKKAKLLEKDLENLQSDSGDFPPKLKLNNSPERQNDNKKTAPEIRKSPPKSKLMIQKELLALKKRALVLRREGQIDEAEEELKKGKALEQQLEEMENGPKSHAPVVSKMDTKSVHFHSNNPQVLDHVDEGFEAEVTDSDLHDPSLLSALKNLGWNDDSSEPINVFSETSMQRNGHEKGPLFPKKMSRSKAEIQKELLAVKRKALSLRRQGNTAEAEEELEKAKALETQIAELESASSMIAFTGKKETAPLHDIVPEVLDLTAKEHEVEVTEEDMLDPALLSGLKNLGWNTNEDNENEPKNIPSKGYKQINQKILDNGISQKAVKSKAEIQKELLAVKRNALALRRQGKSEEANKELEKARVLEDQMVAMEESSKANIREIESNDLGTLVPQRASDNFQASLYPQGSVLGTSSVASGLEYLAFPVTDTTEINSSSRPLESSVTETRTIKSRPSVTESPVSSAAQQSGLLSKSTNFDNDDTTLPSSIDDLSREGRDIFSLACAPIQAVNFNKKTESESNKLHQAALDSQASQMEETGAIVSNISVSSEPSFSHDIDSIKSEIIAHKRKAVALKREGKLAEAREELRKAKLMERTLGDCQSTETARESSSSTSSHISAIMQPGTTGQNQEQLSIESIPHSTSSNVFMQDNKVSQPYKPLSSRDRFRIQQESLSHKRNALKLRREGKTSEADAELELAKSLESQLEDPDQSSSTNTHGSKSGGDDVDVEDMLDPQLMSALKAIGLMDAPSVAQPPKKVEANIDKNEKAHIEEQIKSERLRALNFKKAGKQAEALEALRAAKRLEKKLNLIG